LREISQGIANAIKPQIIPTIIMELCDDKNVIKVTVEGDEKPYPAYGKYYMRSADEDREISPQQLHQLMLSVSDSIVNIEANHRKCLNNGKEKPSEMCSAVNENPNPQLCWGEWNKRKLLGATMNHAKIYAKLA